MGLTIKQENFCNKYIECGNASEAYRFAYNCDNWSDNAVYVQASKMLNYPKIILRVEELRDALKEKWDISREDILTDLNAIRKARITDYVEFDGMTMRYKDFSTLPDDKLRAIESVEETKYGIKIKLHGKSWTIEQICKMMGYNAPEKQEHTGKNGEPIQHSHKVEDHKVIFCNFKDKDA